MKAKIAAPKARNIMTRDRAMSAKGAEYNSQGQARSASPLVKHPKEASRPEGPKYVQSYSALSGLGAFNLCLPGATSRQSRDLPLAIIFRAFGAVII